MNYNMATRLFSFLLLMPLPGMAIAAESLSGTVYGPSNEKVKYAAIRATNQDTGATFRSQSGTDGSYLIEDLPAGMYQLEVKTMCCAYKRYSSDALQAPGSETFDIHLEEGSSFNTVGDDPGVIAAFIRDRQVIPDEPPPRLGNGRPDLSGTWLLEWDPFPEEADALPWAQELHDERAATNFRDHPGVYCLPSELPFGGGTAPFIGRFVHQEDLLLILFESVPGYRQVFIDGTKHPEWPDPSWMGHSVASWDSDHLVVDTVGFNDRGWTNGYPRSEELHIIEKYSRPEYGRIELEVTFEDPKVFRKPWVHHMVLYLAPQEQLMEYVCENNKWAPTE